MIIEFVKIRPNEENTVCLWPLKLNLAKTSAVKILILNGPGAFQRKAGKGLWRRILI
jgi:hypothetical protein